MIVKPNTILPDEGKILHRISDDSYGKGYSGNVDPDDFEEITLDEYGAMLAARSDAEAAYACATASTTNSPSFTTL